MKPTDEQHQCTCQDALAGCQWSSNSTINHLPDEVLLEIFYSFRRSIHPYEWSKNYPWFSLTHVCRRWRAIMFESTSRLDLGITLGPIKPGDIETILSGPLPILINYKCEHRSMTESALWRLHAALIKHDRVRGISFNGKSAGLDEIFSATSCTFPMLECLVLRSYYGENLKIPDTFLGGPDLSNLRLRRLELDPAFFKDISRLLLSTSALTDLHLNIDTTFGTSPETSLLACLQGMPFLCCLNLFISSSLLESSSLPSTFEDIVPLSKLTHFRYTGHSVFLEAIMAGLSAPFLWHVNVELRDKILSPSEHLPRFINEIKEHFRTAHVTFGKWVHLTLFTQSEASERSWLYFEFHPAPGQSAESMMRMTGALSSKLITVEELCITLARRAAEDDIQWRKFYQQFPNVKVLQTHETDYSYFARTLLQDLENHAFFPALEEIELGVGEIELVADEFISRSREGRGESELAAFDPIISARQQAGHPVKVYFGP